MIPLDNAKIKEEKELIQSIWELEIGCSDKKLCLEAVQTAC